jgi:tetratricopeptide (TPR) repeat protein
MKRDTNMIVTRGILLLCSLISVLSAAPADLTDPGVGTADELRVARELNASAEQYMDQGLYEEARRLYLRSLPLMEKALGREHPGTLTTLGNLCDATVHMSTYLDAKPLCTRSLALREKVFGPGHPDVARSLSDLGLLYANEGDLAHAESLLRQALRIDSASANSADVPTLLNNLGFLYSKKKKYALAEDSFERAIASTEQSKGPEDPDLVTMLSNVASVYFLNHNFEAARKRFRRALEIAQRLSASEQTVRILVGLARAEAGLGNTSEAKTLIQRAERLVEQSSQLQPEWRASMEAARLDLVRR